MYDFLYKTMEQEYTTYKFQHTSMKHTHFKPSRLMLACLGLLALAAISISVVTIFGNMLGAQVIGARPSECSDLIDNDGDGQVDRNDPGCDDLSDASERSSTECDDGRDNDGDTYRDFSVLPLRQESPTYWQNPLNRFDVDNDQLVSYDDSNAVLIDVQTNGSRLLPTSGSRSAYLDVNGDGYATDSDAYEVMFFLSKYGREVYTPDPHCGSPTDSEAPDCGDGVVEGDEVCDDGGRNGWPGKCNYTCTGTSPVTECNDGKDNDNDGVMDTSDPGCTDAADTSERSATLQCDDGKDNDSDAAVDFPSDVSCESPSDSDESNPKAACYDGLDNDNDGRTDTRDPGCSSTQDMSENSEPSSTTLTGVIGNGCTITVQYSKTQPGCVYLLTSDTREFVNRGNLFCANSGPVVINKAQTNSRFALSRFVTLCRGSNFADCSAPVPITGDLTCNQ